MTRKPQSDADEEFPLPEDDASFILDAGVKEIPQRPLIPDYKSWATNTVKCRGKPLDRPFIWMGEQWAVTPFGIEKRDGTCAIKAEDLTVRDEQCPWEQYIFQKRNWTEVAEFRVAMAVALDYFGRELRLPDLKTRWKRVLW